VTLALDKPFVYLISDGTMTEQNYRTRAAGFLDLVELASAVRIPLIQIREKHISARCLFELAGIAVTMTRSSQTRILVNDRIDIAIAAKTDGVHLTSRSASSLIIRRCVPKDFLVVVSTHSSQEVAAAKQGGADLAVLGPVFATPGKSNPIGLERFRSVASKYPEFPLLALGGIDEGNYRDVLAAGAAGFAAIRFLNNAQNLEKLSEEFIL
jgi:thiamine-phosphate pyrophosphorylase